MAFKHERLIADMIVLTLRAFTSKGCMCRTCCHGIDSNIPVIDISSSVRITMEHRKLTYTSTKRSLYQNSGVVMS